MVDSGAVESVCPWDWATVFPIKVAWNQTRNSDARNPSASVAGHGNIVQFESKEEDNCIFNPSTEEVQFQRVGSSGLKQAPPANTEPRVGNKGVQKGCDELAGVENMEQGEEDEDVEPKEAELGTRNESEGRRGGSYLTHVQYRNWCPHCGRAAAKTWTSERQWTRTVGSGSPASTTASQVVSPRGPCLLGVIDTLV